MILSRPDPQVIWATSHSDAWKRADAVYARSQRGGGSWQFNRSIPQSWTISYGSLKLKVSPTGFKHTGLFPEQAVNWDLMADIIRSSGRRLRVLWTISYGSLKLKVSPTGFKHTGLFPEQAVNWDLMADIIRSSGRRLRVLNLFAYTGGATLACAKAGAEVCHVDAARSMVKWGRENAELSGLGSAPIRWIVDDCKVFVQREIRRGSFYDAVIMDPPSYGRGPSGEVWHLEDSIFDLVKTISGVLTKNPEFFIINSYTTGLSPSVTKNILALTIGKQYGGELSASDIGLPITSEKIYLPCGSTAIWRRA